MSGQVSFIGMVCFRESICAALLALADGSSLSIAGDLKASGYTNKNGEACASLDVTVQEILTIHHLTKRRDAIKGTKADLQVEQPTSPNTPQSANDDFDDDIPF